MAQKERNEVADQYKWNLTDLYTSVEQWREEKEKLAPKISELESYKGTLGRSAADLKKFLLLDDEVSKTLARLAIYASLKSDEDVSVAENIALVKEIEILETEVGQRTAFALPEMSAIEDETYRKFMAQEPELEQFRMQIDRIIKDRKHTLSDAEEALMAKFQICGNTPYSAYSIFSDAEMPWAKVKLEDGTEVELDASMFAQVRASKVREDRKVAFEAFWENYKKFEGTFGELMNGNMRRILFRTKARNYESCLESALSYNNIPVEVYTSLIENVNKNLPTFHRYLALKKRLMGVDRLEYYDIYAPAVDDIDLKYTYEEAQQMVLDAIKPLGADYAATVQRAFDERWIDVFPNKGKATGAYSNGAAYDVHPYILMNFNGRYGDVGTLIHELGHTMQSYYSNKTQPYAMCYYSIFVAEVASTFNEALLDHLMLETVTDKKQRISLLMSMLDGFKGTLFRQTQFAEFQLRMSEMVEKGEPITGSKLTEIYGELVRKYYGHDEGVCNVDERVNIEWAYIPHFYMGFYVYQYSTSFVASQALSEMVLSGDASALEKYMNFLSAGDSKYPIEELKDAGVDMMSAEPFEKAIGKMNMLMDEIEKLL